MCVCVFVDGCVSQNFSSKLSVAIEHVNSDCAESDDDPLALVFLSLRFLSAAQIRIDSNCAAPLLMRQRHFVGS